MIQDEVVLKNIETEGINNVKDQMQKIYNIWIQFGINIDQKSHRAKVVWNHVQNLLKDIYDEENSFYEEIKERIKNYTIKIKELSVMLAVAQNEPQGSLIKIEEILRQELDNLTRLKHKRVTTYQDLKKIELKYCQILNLQEHQLPSDTGVPSEGDLSELEQHVNMLKDEKDRREKKFCLLKKELATILETTELKPESSLELEILSGKETLPLTDETFQAMKEVIIKAQKKKAELEAKKKDLVDKLTILWQRLKVEESKRVEFLLKHSDCQIKTISFIEQELQRCENLKKQNISMFVSDLRIELIQLWDKCHVSEPERIFPYLSTTEMSDEVLEAHEEEVDKWKKHYAKIEHILTKIEKRQGLWELMIIFENKATDPNRFKNRKGNLLQEERERKKLQKDLPSLENDIFCDIETFETETASDFLYKGENFKDFVTYQWAERNRQKESEKIERQNLHLVQLINDAALGTPAKRPLKTTPKTAPSKLFKSAMGTPVFRTPSSSNSRVVPSTVGKVATKNTRLFPSRSIAIQKKDRNVLKEKNKQATPRAKTTCPNGTTYTDFASELNSPARYHFRSSVLATKKPGGTKTSQTEIRRSKRKSAATSLRKSITSKTAPNLTPARGKLGLPFLI